MIKYDINECPHCKEALCEGCFCLMCSKCHKLFKPNGEEVKEDGSNFFTKPSNINWNAFKK